MKTPQNVFLVDLGNDLSVHYNSQLCMLRAIYIYYWCGRWMLVLQSHRTSQNLYRCIIGRVNCVFPINYIFPMPVLPRLYTREAMSPALEGAFLDPAGSSHHHSAESGRKNAGGKSESCQHHFFTSGTTWKHHHHTGQCSSIHPNSRVLEDCFTLWHHFWVEQEVMSPYHWPCHLPLLARLRLITQAIYTLA